jgi:hypothetical protein
MVDVIALIVDGPSGVDDNDDNVDDNDDNVDDNDDNVDDAIAATGATTTVEWFHATRRDKRTTMHDRESTDVTRDPGGCCCCVCRCCRCGPCRCGCPWWEDDGVDGAIVEAGVVMVY